VTVLGLDAFRLDGRTAVVTGAARGLGAAIAVALAEFGADLVICDREDQSATVSSIEVTGRRVVASTLDVRDQAAVAEWLGGVEVIDVVVNNAGGTFHGAFLDASANAQRSARGRELHQRRQRGPLGRGADVARWQHHQHHLGRGVQGVTRIRRVRGDEGSGRASVQITRARAVRAGIRVNTVAPDALRTPGDDELLVGDDDYGAKLALGWGEPADITGAVVYLASSASRFVTGTTIHVDGGSDAARGWRRTPDGWWP
jgi:3-oxoacyl-[acyl-carrier protein] reductase